MSRQPHCPRTAVRFAFALTFTSLLICSGCSEVTSAPSPTSDTTPAAAAVTETFSSVLPVGGTKFYSFSIAEYGTVTATLRSIGGAGVPDSVIVNLGLGRPSGISCSATPTAVQVTGDAGLTTMITATQQPGIYCVIVSDVGNLASPANFTITIDHP